MAVTLPFATTCQYADTGITWGLDPATPTSPFIDITKIDGLDSAPFRVTSRSREGSDGGFMDAEFEEMRVISIEGTAYNYDAADLQLLKANFSPGKTVQPFYVYLDGDVGQRVVFCKSLGLRYSIDAGMRLGVYQLQAQVQAEDPSIYADPATSVSSGITGTYGGFGFNLAFNFGFGTSASPGSASAYNYGDKPADATIRIDGPVINPTIVRDQEGAALSFNYTVNTGDYLLINLRNRTVLLNGTANRRSALTGTSKWFMIQPGANSILFLGTAGAGTPNMTVTYRSAYR